MSTFRFKLGADPEFHLVAQNRRLHAEQTIGKYFGGNGGTLVLPGVGEVGHDGASATGEFRVEPSNDPAVLTGHFRTLIGKIVEKVPFADISPLSTFAPVGGHIHLEVAPNSRWSEAKTQNIIRKIASFYLPLMLGENKLNAQIRLRGGSYGRISDARCDSHGNSRTIEYRAPSPEWLITPKITEATFAYMGVIYNEILKGNTKAMAKARPMLMKNSAQMEALQTLASSDYLYLIKALCKDMKAIVSEFEAYPDFKDLVDYILTPERVIADKEKVGYELTHGWGFVGTTNFTSRQLVSDKIFEEKSKGMNLDQVGQLINISYNTDANVEHFSRKLSERVSAFKWKLKNSYFLFGMRKGIQDIIVRNGEGTYLQGADVCKTAKDLTAMNTLFDRMRDRYYSKVGKPGKLIMDFMSTGKQNDGKNTIIIGLPYDMRRQGSIRPLLEAVYRAERGRIRAAAKSFKELPDDPAAPGEIHKILSTNEEDLPFDTGSNDAVHLNERAVEALVAEMDGEAGAEF